MGIFFVYIIKTAFCLATFYLFYRLLLSKETFHRFNRMALLNLLLLSCLIPLIEVTVQDSIEVNRPLLSLEEMLMMAELNTGILSEEAGVSMKDMWCGALLLVYVIGIIFFLFCHLGSFAKMLLLLRSCKKERLQGGVVLYTHNKEIAPFSWMRFIVIAEKDLQENGDAILAHEYAHLEHKHSWDLLLADFCIFFQWFNPAAWLLKQELQNIHEYEADESVINQGIDAKKYQLLLIKKAVGTRLYSMANSFNHSSLKKRITMMIKKKSSPWARLKYLYILPLTAFTIAAFARSEISKEFKEISRAKANDLTSIAKVEGVKSVEKLLDNHERLITETKTIEVGEKKSPILQIVEVMPFFPGGMGNLMTYLAKNINYPKEALEMGAEGRVVVKLVIEKDGTPTNFEVVRKVNPLLDAEAVRVLSLMPKWEPGKQGGEPVRTSMTIPVIFRLAEKPVNSVIKDVVHLKIEEDANVEGVYAAQSILKTSSENDFQHLNSPLVFVDGIKTEYSQIKKIEPTTIETVHVLKDETAVSKYGEEGKHGVILITMKKNR